MKRLTDRELTEKYDDFLEEVFGDISVCGYKYSASRVLKAIDPIAYRCGENDWLDGEISCESIIEKNGEYYDNYD